MNDHPLGEKGGTNVIFATTPYDEWTNRQAPDVTELVSKAVERFVNRAAADPDETDFDDIIETELDAVAAVLRAALTEALSTLG